MKAAPAALAAKPPGPPGAPRVLSTHYLQGAPDVTMRAAAPPGASQYYGRRQGRRLRLGRARLIDELLPRLSLALPAPGEALAPASLFGRPATEFWLEIGFGAGEHLAAQADRRRDVGIIGCEPYLNGIAGLLARVDALGLDNVRIFAEDARLLLAALPDDCLARVFILFPDPWPKKRHWRRRIVAAATLAELARVMRAGAELRLATDHAEYGQWMLAHVLRAGAFDWLAERPADWRERPADWPQTRFETKAKNAGRASLYLRFRRRARARADNPGRIGQKELAGLAASAYITG